MPYVVANASQLERQAKLAEAVQYALRVLAQNCITND